jgi:hypothetical protein
VRPGIRLVILAIALILTPIIVANAQDATDVIDLGNATRIVIVNNESDSIFSWDNFWLIVVTLGAAVGTAILTPLVRERYKVREQYIIPYRTWCISFSGMLHEFYELCKAIQKPEPKEEVTDTDTIVHLWAMHGEVEKGFRWIYVVKQDNWKVGKKLDNLMDGVDVLWHRLQDTHRELLGKQATNDELYAILELMSIIQREKIETIAKEIRTEIQNVEKPQEEQPFNKENIEEILDMLKEKIPKKYLGLPYHLQMKHCRLQHDEK